MPTFDFQCRKCSTVFEFSRPFGSDQMPACPACKSKRTEKLFAPPVIHFKGSGFYKTDSGKTSAPVKKKEEKTEETKTPEKTEGKEGKKEDKKAKEKTEKP